MNAFKMTAVAATLTIISLATDNAQAQMAYTTPYVSYSAPYTLSSPTAQFTPTTSIYSTAYAGNFYGNNLGSSNWNNRFNNQYGQYYSNGYANNYRNNWNYNNYSHQNHSQFNQYGNPQFNQPYFNGASNWATPRSNWGY